MVQNKLSKSLGICSTCRYAPKCINLVNSKETIWHCEEFEVYHYQEKHKPTYYTSETDKKKDGEKYMGLCVNCDHRETCTLCKPEGGVWQCGEYQ